jgi:hypothetical protein
MDSLTQATLGAAVGVAVMGRRTAAWKAALWGAALGTLPDMDVVFDFGDPIRNMTEHRAESHAIFTNCLRRPCWHFWWQGLAYAAPQEFVVRRTLRPRPGPAQ